MRSAIANPATLAALLLLTSLSGCARHHSGLGSPQRMEKGLTLVLPGIEGKGFLNQSIRDGLADGGVPTAIRIYDWTLGTAMLLVNQMSETRARRKGEDLACYIMGYKILHPAQPVFLVAHSGGSAVATFTAESMPAGQSIDGVILLGASIGPEYDLSAALEHVEGKFVNYYSHKDTGLLGVATTIFGTVDREHGSAAGRVGFQLPRGASPRTLLAYRGLEQHPWEPAWALSGNHGGHTDWVDRRFIRDYIAPRLQGRIAELANPAYRRTRLETDPVVALTGSPPAPAEPKKPQINKPEPKPEPEPPQKVIEVTSENQPTDRPGRSVEPSDPEQPPDTKIPDEPWSD